MWMFICWIDMLESPDTEDEPAPVKDAKQSYAACMNRGESGLNK